MKKGIGHDILGGSTNTHEGEKGRKQASPVS